MSRRTRFSDLESKFHLLLLHRRNPDIHELKDIAARLQGRKGPLKAHNLPQYWFPTDSIPEIHVTPICGMLSITPAMLQMDLQSFEGAVSKVPDSMVSVPVRGAVNQPAFLMPHLIHRIDELEFEDFLELMEKEFPDPDIRDPDQDLEMWLREAETSKARKPSCVDQFLVAKDANYGMVVALLYASHFPTLGFLFISYLAIDHELVEAIRDSGQVFLAEAVKKTATKVLLQAVSNLNWTKGVLTEIAHDGKEKKLKRLFLRYARRIFGGNIYEIDIEYVQPALDPQGLQSVRQDLLYMPGPEHQALINENKTCLPRDEMVEILRFVYQEIYAGNFDTTPYAETYRAEVEQVFQRVSGALPRLVPLRPIQAPP
jgi:hypothetical protein